jgi:hypothetical protein
MIVLKEDYDNYDGVNLLPVRRGCGGGPCACMGTCKTIIGYIDYDVYNSFMNKYTSEREFIESNFRPTEDYIDAQKARNLIKEKNVEKEEVIGETVSKTNEGIEFKALRVKIQ